MNHKDLHCPQMNETAICYKVTAASEHMDDVQKLFAAIGTYENKLAFPEDHFHEAKVHSEPNDTVILGLFRTLRTLESQSDMAHARQTMREGVENSLDPCDQERLSAYFIDDDPAKA